jgi:hypothetical protein
MLKIRILPTLVICFSLSFHLANSQSIESLRPIFETSYGEWKLSEEFQTFTPENLFDYINGAADNYLDFDFQELLVAQYRVSEEKYIKVEIYQHNALPQTFGIYASERPVKANFDKIGIQGYRESGLVNFFTNQYYIKILSHDTQAETNETMLKIAQHLSLKLNTNGKMPEVLSFFPPENKLSNSETFTNNNFLGYEFLKKAYTCQYQKGSKLFKIFIVENASKEEALKALKQYTEKLKMNWNIQDKLYLL